MEINITWNICRVCLVEEEKKPQTDDMVGSMRHIFTEDEMLAKQIFECSGITMKPNDNLPEKICKKCFTMVKYAVKFRNICRASDTYLQSILQRTKSASVLFTPEKGKSRRDSKSVETHCKKTTVGPEKSDSICDHELSNIDEADKLFDYSSSNEITYPEQINPKRNINNIEESKECKINENLEESVVQDINTNDICSESDNFEEKHEGDLSDLKTNMDCNLHTSNDYVSASNVEQNVDEEYCIESFEQDDNSQLSSSQEIFRHLVSDVSSTVQTKEYDIEIDEENCSLLSDSNDGMQTEYIVDEYLIDPSSSDITMRKSAVVTFGSNEQSNKIKTEEFSGKHSAISSSSLKPVAESRVVWICDLCGNNFISRQLLQSHMKIHRQEKKHECEICSKRFITACNLQAHMRVHTGEKPFECKYCQRRFSDRSANLRHERTHTNEKPFQCKDCGKAFSLSTTLKKHLKVHTGERSYRCDICMKSFTLPHQLKAHKNSSIHKAIEQLEQ